MKLMLLKDYLKSFRQVYQIPLEVKVSLTGILQRDQSSSRWCFNEGLQKIWQTNQSVSRVLEFYSAR